GLEDAESSLGADHRRRPGDGADLVEHETGGGLAATGDRTPPPVEDALARDGAHRAREVVDRQRAVPLPQPIDQVAHDIASARAASRSSLGRSTSATPSSKPRSRSRCSRSTAGAMSRSTRTLVTTAREPPA